MRYLLYFCFFTFVSCASSNLLESINSDKCYIVVGRLHVKDTTSKCQFNTIGISNKYNIIFTDRNEYFCVRILSDTCTITNISKFSIKQHWKVKSLKRNCINYIGDIDIIIAPKRETVWLSRSNYDSDTKDVHLRSQELCGPNSDYHKWYIGGCFDPAWSDVLKQGYYVTAPKSITENEILKFEIKDNYNAAVVYFKQKNKKELNFEKSLLIYSK